jgi:hypothetical protein
LPADSPILRIVTLRYLRLSGCPSKQLPTN